MKIKWIGKGIKLNREKRGLTVDELAELSSVESSTISHAENDTDRSLSFEKIIKIFNALEINFSDCLGIESEQQLLSNELKNRLKVNYNDKDIRFFCSVLEKLIKISEDNYG